MSFGIDRYTGHWRDVEGYRLEIKKINEEQASASLLSPLGFPVNRPYFEGKPTVHMPAIYDDYEGTMEVQLWGGESGFVLELLHEPAYDLDESRREALVPALSRYEEDYFLDQYYDLFGRLKHYTREETSAEPSSPFDRRCGP